MNEANIKYFIESVCNERLKMISKGWSHFKGETYENTIKSVFYWVESTKNIKSMVVFREKILRTIVPKKHMKQFDNIVKFCKLKPINEVNELCLKLEL